MLNTEIPSDLNLHVSLFDPIPTYSFDVFTNKDKPETPAGREFRMCVSNATVKGNKFKVALLVPQVPNQLPGRHDTLDLILYPENVTDPETPIRVVQFTLDSEADPDLEVDAALSKFGLNPLVTLHLTYKIKNKKVITAKLGDYLKAVYSQTEK